MSRRKGKVERAAAVVYVECPTGHRVGMCCLQRFGSRPGRSPFRIGLPLKRIDGPNGETKVKVATLVAEALVELSNRERLIIAGEFAVMTGELRSVGLGVAGVAVALLDP